MKCKFPEMADVSGELFCKLGVLQVLAANENSRMLQVFLNDFHFWGAVTVLKKSTSFNFLK